MASDNLLRIPGYVMSDWGATHSMSIAAGLDVEQPGGQEAAIRRLLQNTVFSSAYKTL